MMTLVWDFFDRGGSDKLAMLALADWCDDKGLNLYPSISGIAKKINVSESQARRIIHKFIEEGYLQVIGNHDGGAPSATRRYRMVATRFVETPSMDATPSADATPSMGAHDPLHGCAQPLAPMTPEPPLTTNKATANKPARDLPDWLPEKSLSDFKAHRKAMKKPMTEQAEALLIVELEKLRAAGHDPVSCLNTAILKGWQMPYAPKSDQQRSGTRAEQIAKHNEQVAAEFLGGGEKVIEAEVVNA